MNLALLISEETELIRDLQKALRGETVVVEVESGDEALELVKKSSVSLVLLHAQEPALPTLELLRKLKDFSQDQTIVVLAETKEPDIISQALAAGAYDWLTLPYEDEELRQIVKRATERQKLVDEVSLLRHQRKGTRKDDFSAERSSAPAPFGRGDYYYPETLKRFSKAITQIFDLEHLCQMILISAVEIFGITKGSLILEEKGTGHFSIRASVGLNERITRGLKFDSSDALVRYLKDKAQIIQRRMVVVNLQREGYPRIKREMEMIEAEIAIPLFSRGNLIGLLSLNNKMIGGEFNAADLELLSVVANYGAVAIENALLYRELSFQKKSVQDVLDHIVSGVISVNRDGQITTYNQAAEKILGLSSREALGKNIRVLDRQLSELISECLKEGKTYSRHETRTTWKNIPLGVSTSLLKNAEGEAAGAIMVFADLTKLKELEEEKQRVERFTFWSYLTTRMAQEIKNPLVPIRTFTQLLPERYHDSEFRKDFYEVVSQEVSRLDGLIDQLINFARPREPEFTPGNLNHLVEETLTTHKEQIESQKIEIRRYLDASLPEVLIDLEKMRQVFSGIVLNALRSMGKVGVLSVATRLKDHSSVEIEFSDTGEGIKEEDLGKIFSPFFTTRIKGVGLGLSIAQRIIEEHKGRIEANSRSEEGATFIITLPLSREGVLSEEIK